MVLKTRVCCSFQRWGFGTMINNMVLKLERSNSQNWNCFGTMINNMVLKLENIANCFTDSFGTMTNSIVEINNK